MIQFNKMFDIDFEGEFKAIAYRDSENTLKFDPPVYEQRYSAVLRCLQSKRWSGQFKKVSRPSQNMYFNRSLLMSHLTDC